MSPVLMQLLFALANQAPSAIAAAQAMLTQKGNPTEQDWLDLASKLQADRAAAEQAIHDAFGPKPNDGGGSGPPPNPH